MTSLSSAHIILQLNSDNAGEGSHPRDPLLTTVEGERFEEAACREMFEETGVRSRTGTASSAARYHLPMD